MTTYFLRHLQVLFQSLGRLARTPFASLMTIAVISITLALPSGLHVLLENARAVTSGWEGGAQISLFLKRDTSDQVARALAEQLQRSSRVAKVDYISRTAALEEFKRLSGFGQTLNALERNPLPPVLVVYPMVGGPTPVDLESLVAEFNRVGDVEIAQLDMQWVKRLRAILNLAQRGVVLLGVLLGIAVLLIMANTIRLAILNRRDEIEVIKLIGGTDGFIRRPFLYEGVLQGLVGAAGAWIVVHTTLVLMADPIRRLASLYASGYELRGLGLLASLGLLAAGGLLGWTGSWLAVGRHLRAIEPR